MVTTTGNRRLDAALDALADVLNDEEAGNGPILDAAIHVVDRWDGPRRVTISIPATGVAPHDAHLGAVCC